MADQGFCVANARLRGAVLGRGSNRSKKETRGLLGDDGHSPRTKIAGSTIGLAQGLSDINANLHASGDSARSLAENRCCRQEKEDISSKSIDMLSHNSSHISAQIPSHLDTATPAAMSEQKSMVYDEYNVSVSPDFAYIYSWVLGTAHLVNVPAHYLMPDPSFLPEETLRFFFIDDDWIDALIVCY